MFQIRTMIFILAVIILLAACSPSAALEPEFAGDPENGREVYENRKRVRCDHCHTLDESNRRGGPGLLGISDRAAERVPGLSAVEYLEQSLLEPNAYIVEGSEYEMKAYQVVNPDEVEFMLPGMLTQEEFNDLIAFLLTQ